MFLLLIRINLLLLSQFFYRTIRQGWYYSDFVSVELLTAIKLKQLIFHLHDMKGRHRRCTSSMTCEAIPERNMRCFVRDGTHTYCIETPDWCPDIFTSITLSYSCSVISFSFRWKSHHSNTRQVWKSVQLWVKLSFSLLCQLNVDKEWSPCALVSSNLSSSPKRIFISFVWF